MAMGYQGYVTIDGVSVLCNGSSVNPQFTPIYSTGVSGLGFAVAASKTHYAEGGLVYTGDVTVDFGTPLVAIFLPWAITARNTTKPVVIVPDGLVKQTYTAYCGGLNLSASSGGLVTAGITLFSTNRVETSETNTACENHMPAGALNPSLANTYPIPFWKTIATVTGVTGAATQWNMSLNNNPTPLYVCNGSKNPLTILMGPIDGTGTVSFYNETGVGPVTTAADTTAFSVDLDGTNTLDMLFAALTSDDYAIQGASNPVVRTFGFDALGDGTSAPITFNGTLCV